MGGNPEASSTFAMILAKPTAYSAITRIWKKLLKNSAILRK
jgi:hypothetical protein